MLGFEVRIDFSWFVIFFLVFWSLAAGVFPAEYPDLSPATHSLMGLAGTLLFFASLLIHELSHALVAWLLLSTTGIANDAAKQLADAVAHGDAAEVQAALAKGADANGMRNGTPLLATAITRRKADIARLLLAAG